jgi:hypothetical protein
MAGAMSELTKQLCAQNPEVEGLHLYHEESPSWLPPNIEWDRECRKRRRTDRALDGLDLAHERMLIREKRSKLPAALRRAVMNSSKGTWQVPEKPNRG